MKFGIWLFSAFLWLSSATKEIAYKNTETAESVFDHFITREGDKLMNGREEFRFAGANMPGLSVPYDYTLRFPDRLILPTPWEQEDAFKTLVQMNARVVRLWNLPIRGPEDDWMDWAYVQGPGKFNEEAFKTIDHLLAFANQYGIRVIFSLTAEWGDYLGGIGEYAAWREKERSEFYTDAQCKNDFKATLKYVVNRRNTVTGQLYRDDKAVLAWQLGNELRNAPLEWEAEMSDFLKSMDPNHLVMAGNDNQIPENPPENLDILVRHYYGGDWVENCKEDRALAKGKRPFIVGEYGLTSDVEATRAFYDEALENGTSGHLIWSLYFHHRFGGFYWHQIFTHPSIGSFHWPGFESGSAHNERQMLQQLREYCYRMQGLEVPEVPEPEAPFFLPLTEDLPLLTWRGSAGAEGYDIERSESPSGPWNTIATGVSDAAVAYRPLFNDETADPGRSYYYQVSARNSAGRSQPSNVLGPLRFRSQVLVDELHDFQKVHRRSDSLKIDNHYSGLYGEYLFRAKGEQGDEVVYQVPGTASTVRLWVFFNEEVESPRVAVSESGNHFREVILQSEESQKLSSFSKVDQLAGMKRVLVKYEAVLESPARAIRIGWRTTMELDRVEIEYDPK